MRAASAVENGPSAPIQLFRTQELADIVAADPDITGGQLLQLNKFALVHLSMVHPAAMHPTPPGLKHEGTDVPDGGLVLANRYHPDPTLKEGNVYAGTSIMHALQFLSSHLSRTVGKSPQAGDKIYAYLVLPGSRFYGYFRQVMLSEGVPHPDLRLSVMATNFFVPSAVCVITHPGGNGENVEMWPREYLIHVDHSEHSTLEEHFDEYDRQYKLLVSGIIRILPL